MLSTSREVIKNNINVAARVFSYHCEIASWADNDKKYYNALNKTPTFWNDFHFIAIQSVIISLGRIFDEGPDTINLPKALNDMHRSLSRNDDIQHRNETATALETAIHSSNLTKQNVKKLKREATKAKRLWKAIAPARNRIFAHSIATGDEKSLILKEISYLNLKEIIQIVLDILFLIEMSELNGYGLNFENNEDTRPAAVASSQIERLISAIAKGCE